MSSNSPSRTVPQLLWFVFVLFTAIGIVAGLLSKNFGITTTWIWFAIGVSVTYLLYQMAVAVEHIAYDS